MSVQFTYSATALAWATSQNQSSAPPTILAYRNWVRLCNSLNDVFEDDSLSAERKCGFLKAASMLEERALKSIVLATDTANAGFFNDFSEPYTRNIQLFRSMKVDDNKLYLLDENSEWNRVNPNVFGKSAGLLRAIPLSHVFEDNSDPISLTDYFAHTHSWASRVKDSSHKKSLLVELKSLRGHACSTLGKLAALPLFLREDEDSESNQDNNTLASSSTTPSTDSSTSAFTITATDMLQNLSESKLFDKKVSIGKQQVPQSLILVGVLQPQIHASVGDLIRTATGDQGRDEILATTVFCSPKALALAKKGFVSMASNDSAGLNLFGLHNFVEFRDKGEVAKLKKQLLDLEEEKSYGPLAPDFNERFAAVMATSIEPSREDIKPGHLQILRLWGMKYVSLLVAANSPCLNWFEALNQTYTSLTSIFRGKPLGEVKFCEWFVAASRVAIREGMMTVARAACKTVTFDTIERNKFPVEALVNKLIVKADEFKDIIPPAPALPTHQPREAPSRKKKGRDSSNSVGGLGSAPGAVPSKSAKKKRKTTAADVPEEEDDSTPHSSNYIASPVNSSTLTQLARATLKDHIDLDDGLKPLLFRWVRDERIRDVCIFDLCNGECKNPNCRLASAHGDKSRESTLLESFKKFAMKN
jgi:hypothetical protein